MLLGKKVRLSRLLNEGSGKLLAIAVDHSIARGVYKGLMPIKSTIENIVKGGADSITMHKGIAENCFGDYAGRISLIIKCSSFSPFQPNYDAWVTDVEEGVRLGADAVSMGCIVGGAEQFKQIENLGKISKQATEYGMPLIAHIYPRGELIPNEEKCSWKNVAYAVRAGAELGVDIVKTNYTGDPDSFSKVVESCPTRVVIAGGEKGEKAEDYFKMVRDVMDIGCLGVTFGRFVWGYSNIPALIGTLKYIIHENGTVKEAMELLRELEEKI